MAEACCAPGDSVPGSTAPPDPSTLTGVADGGRAMICAVGGSRPLACRLMEMGLLPGTEVRMVRRATFGDPLEVRLREFNLSLRRRDADAIEVMGLAPGASEALGDEPPEVAGLPEPPVREGTRDATPKVLLAGNPNSGKTTVFNALTGSRARVGNYPGVTVERRSGTVALEGGDEVELVDLPGTYSLAARSPEEEVAVDALLGVFGAPAEAVVVVVDANALDRNLYLALQLKETGVPLVLALNMMDEVRASGTTLDTAALARAFGAEVVELVASRGEGLDELLAAVGRALARTAAADALDIGLPEDARAALAPVVESIEGWERAGTPATREALARWAVLSLGDDELVGIPPGLRAAVDAARAAAEAAGRNLEREIIEARYRFVEGVTAAVRRPGPEPEGRRWTDRIDDVLTHKIWGSLVFLLVMGVVFQTLFAWCDPFIGWIEEAVAGTQGWLKGVLPAGFLQDLLVDGVVAGVGNVVVFVPQIAALFLLIGFLEDCGYLARVAFVMDRLMGGVGLHGRAFVPMLSGFACAIPAAMATRTIENRTDRLLTMMTLPLMSCSARLPVYVLLTAVIFPPEATVLGGLSVGAAVLAGMYALSVLATLGAAAVLRRTVLTGARPPLVLELPPYRWPVARNLLTATWFRVKKFLKDAGTIILAMTVLLWGLLTFPKDPTLDARYAERMEAATMTLDPAARAEAVAAVEGAKVQEALESSYAGRLGKALEPAFEPLGFDWRVSIGILGAFAAREVFVSTMGVVFGIADATEEDFSLRRALQEATWPDGRPLMTPLVGISLMVFFVLACQCMSTLAVVQRESGSWKWPLGMLAYMSAMAYGASLLIYQGGRLLGY